MAVGIPVVAPDKPIPAGYGEKGETNKGRSNYWMILRIAAAAVAVVNTVNAIKIADMQKDLADEYLSISKRLRNFYSDTYQPSEDTEIEEACNAKTDPARKKTVRLKLRGSIVGMFKDKWDTAVKCSGRYQTGMSGATMYDLRNAEARAVANSLIVADDMEEKRIEALDQVRISRLDSALNRGRDIVSSAMNATNIARPILGNMLQSSVDGASNALYAFNYAGERNKVQAEQNRAPIRNLTVSDATWTAPNTLQDTRPAIRGLAPNIIQDSSPPISALGSNIVIHG